MKQVLLIYLCSLILFGIANTQSSTGQSNGGGNGNSNSNSQSSNSNSGISSESSTTTAVSSEGYSIAESFNTAKPYPFLPVFSNDDVDCDTYVTDFASNGVDRVIVVGTTLSHKIIDDESGCHATPSTNSDMHGVPFIAMKASDESIEGWKKFIPYSYEYMGLIEPYSTVKQIVAVKYSGIYGLDTGATSAPGYKTPLFAVFVKAYSTSTLHPDFSSMVLIMDESDGSIQKVFAAQNYHWDLNHKNHPFVFQINGASADSSVAENFRFYTTEKLETGVVMGDLSTGRLAKRSNAQSTTYGQATALVFHDGSLYVGGSYCRDYTALYAANNSLNPEEYRSPYFMKVSDDISTVTWSYAEQFDTQYNHVKTVDQIEAHYTGYTDVLWAISRRIKPSFDDLDWGDYMTLYRIHTDTMPASGSFTRDGQQSQVAGIKMEVSESFKGFVSNLYFDPSTNDLGITYYSKNSTNNDFRTTRFIGLEDNLYFASNGSLLFSDEESITRTTKGHDWCDSSRCVLQAAHSANSQGGKTMTAFNTAQASGDPYASWFNVKSKMGAYIALDEVTSSSEENYFYEVSETFSSIGLVKVPNSLEKLVTSDVDLISDTYDQKFDCTQSISGFVLNQTEAQQMEIFDAGGVTFEGIGALGQAQMSLDSTWTSPYSGKCPVSYPPFYTANFSSSDCGTEQSCTQAWTDGVFAQDPDSEGLKITHSFEVPTENKFGFVPNFVNQTTNTAALIMDIWAMKFDKMDDFVKIDVFQNSDSLIVGGNVFGYWFHDTTEALICTPDPTTIQFCSSVGTTNTSQCNSWSSSITNIVDYNSVSMEMTFNLTSAYDKTSETDTGKILIKASCQGPKTMTRQIQLKMQVRDVSATKTDADCSINHYLSSTFQSGDNWNNQIMIKSTTGTETTLDLSIVEVAGTNSIFRLCSSDESDLSSLNLQMYNYSYSSTNYLWSWQEMNMSNIDAQGMSMNQSSTKLALSLSVSNYSWGEQYKVKVNCSESPIVKDCPTMERQFSAVNVFCNQSNQVSVNGEYADPVELLITNTTGIYTIYYIQQNSMSSYSLSDFLQWSWDSSCLSAQIDPSTTVSGITQSFTDSFNLEIDLDTVSKVDTDIKYQLSSDQGTTWVSKDLKLKFGSCPDYYLKVQCRASNNISDHVSINSERSRYAPTNVLILPDYFSYKIQALGCNPIQILRYYHGSFNATSGWEEINSQGWSSGGFMLESSTSMPINLTSLNDYGQKVILNREAGRITEFKMDVLIGQNPDSIQGFQFYVMVCGMEQLVGTNKLADNSTILYLTFIQNQTTQGTNSDAMDSTGVQIVDLNSFNVSQGVDVTGHEYYQYLADYQKTWCEQYTTNVFLDSNGSTPWNSTYETCGCSGSSTGYCYQACTYSNPDVMIFSNLTVKINTQNVFNYKFFIFGETNGLVNYTKEVQVNVCGFPQQNSSVNATFDMLDYNATSLSFTSTNLSAFFVENTQCPFTITNLQVPDLSANLSETQIAGLISSDATNYNLAIDSIALEADYPTLGTNYPTLLEFIVTAQMSGSTDVVGQTDVTITVNFTSLKVAIEAAIQAEEEAAAAAEAARIAAEEAAAAALAAELLANQTAEALAAQELIWNNNPGQFYGAITPFEVALVSKTKLAEANMTSVKDQGYLETASFTSPLASDPEKNDITLLFSNTNKITSFATITETQLKAYQKQFTVDIDKSRLKEKQIGKEYTFQVDIDDGSANKSLTYDFTVKITEFEFEVPVVEEVNETATNETASTSNSTDTNETGDSNSTANETSSSNSTDTEETTTSDDSSTGTQSETEEIEKIEIPAQDLADIQKFGFTVDLSKFRKNLAKKKAPPSLADYFKPKPPKPRLKIGELSPTGSIDIKFNQDLLLPNNLDEFDYSSVFGMGMISSLDGSKVNGGFAKDQTSARRLLKEAQASTDCNDPTDCDALNKKFSWYIDTHNPRKVKIQMEFDKPMAISTNSFGQDNLDILILEERFFRSKENDQTLDLGQKKSKCRRKSTLFCGYMPPIIEDQATVDNIKNTGQSIQEALNALTSGNLIIVILFGGAISTLLGLIRQLQLMMLQSVLTIVYPAHLILFYSICNHLAGMDLLNGPIMYEQLFTFQSSAPLNDTFEQYQIEDLNFLMNTGSMAVVVVIVIANQVFCKLLNWIAKKMYRYKIFRKLGIKAVENMEFKVPMMMLLIDGYIDVALSAILGFIAIQQSKNGEEFINWFSSTGDILNSVMTISMFATIFLLPIINRVIVRKNFLTLNDEETLEKYGVYYRDYKTDTFERASFGAYSLLRRLLIVCILIYMESQTWLQCILIMWISTFNLAYLIHVQPFKTKSLNRMEIFNEFTIYLSSQVHYNFMWEAPRETEDQLMALKQTLGWVQIGVVSLNIVGNLGNVAVATAQDIYASAKKIKEDIQLYIKLREERIAREQLLSDLQDKNVIGQILHEEEEKIAFQFCKDFHDERIWCHNNGLDYRELPEEETFQGYLLKFGFRERREAVQAQIEIRKKRVQTQRIHTYEERIQKLRKRIVKEAQQKREEQKNDFNQISEFKLNQEHQIVGKTANRRAMPQSGNQKMPFKNPKASRQKTLKFHSRSRNKEKGQRISNLAVIYENDEEQEMATHRAEQTEQEILANLTLKKEQKILDYQMSTLTANLTQTSDKLDETLKQLQKRRGKSNLKEYLKKALDVEIERVLEMQKELKVKTKHYNDIMDGDSTNEVFKLITDIDQRLDLEEEIIEDGIGEKFEFAIDLIDDDWDEERPIDSQDSSVNINIVKKFDQNWEVAAYLQCLTEMEHLVILEDEQIGKHVGNLFYLIAKQKPYSLETLGNNSLANILCALQQEFSMHEAPNLNTEVIKYDAQDDEFQMVSLLQKQKKLLYNQVTRHLMHILCTTHRCSRCGTKDQMYNQHLTMEIPVVGGAFSGQGVHELIQYHMQSGQELWTCNKCCQITIQQATKKIVMAPEFMVFEMVQKEMTEEESQVVLKKVNQINQSLNGKSKSIDKVAGLTPKEISNIKSFPGDMKFGKPDSVNDFLHPYAPKLTCGTSRYCSQENVDEVLDLASMINFMHNQQNHDRILKVSDEVPLEYTLFAFISDNGCFIKREKRWFKISPDQELTEEVGVTLI